MNVYSYVIIISLSRWEYGFILRRIYVLGVFRVLERNSLQPPLMSSDWVSKFIYRSVPEYLTHKGTLLLSVTDYKVESFDQRLWPLRWEGSLSCQGLLWHGTLVYKVSPEGVTSYFKHGVFKAFFQCYRPLYWTRWAKYMYLQHASLIKCPQHQI